VRVEAMVVGSVPRVGVNVCTTMLLLLLRMRIVLELGRNELATAVARVVLGVAIHVTAGCVFDKDGVSSRVVLRLAVLLCAESQKCGLAVGGPAERGKQLSRARWWYFR
jgi:hypothetical protein